MKIKKKGFGLEIETFKGRDGGSYLVFRTRQGALNVFVEVEARKLHSNVVLPAKERRGRCGGSFGVK